MLPGHYFTRDYKGRAREIITPVRIINVLGGGNGSEKNYNAVWDTGATATVIGKHVADELNLKSITTEVAYGVDGPYESNCYLVDILLPNNILAHDVKVMSGDFRGFDVLIGMDIITLGDFAITNLNGKTKCSFRMPSMAAIDFAKKSYIEPHKVPDDKQDRNSLCNCGSGKKYKKCCGS